ncbi:hypothetical protein [Sulfidibacter corallicola]|uniref:Uncharacterized protein n=1 Tax=Sulfidibacter corallicola TaxID=2818388 RepID=A0A8A4TGP1_SULCO|nr:hypothetical protein [Sulfidibacter corallicola]QTD47888.1 hypothetical protein J3U87_20070 [Sulfidibacter corallicola]
MNPSEDRCPWCSTPLNIVWVHGHGQCAACGINMEPCCSGSPTEDCHSFGGPKSAEDEKADEASIA